MTVSLSVVGLEEVNIEKRIDNREGRFKSLSGREDLRI